MVDVPAASVATASVAAATPALTPIQVNIANTGQVLQDLTRAIQTAAIPVAPPSGNSVTLATALGNITITLPQLGTTEQQTLLQTLLNLAQAQRPLTLTLQPGSPPTQGVLLLPNVSPSGSPPLVPPSANFPGQTGPSLAVGNVLPAIVLPNISPSSALATAAGSLAALSTFAAAELRALIGDQPAPLIPFTPQAGVATAAQTSTPPLSLDSVAREESAALPPASSGNGTLNIAGIGEGGSLQNLALPSQANASAISPLSNLLQPGNEVTLRVDTVIALNQPAPQSLAPNQILARVTGTGTDGQLILKAGETTLFVKAPASAPIGTNVVLTVDTPKLPPLFPITEQQATNFAALPQLMDALAELDPQALAQMIATRIPQPTEALPGALMFLFSAFKQGNVRDWLGQTPTEQLLQFGKQSILASISHELANAGQSRQDDVVGEWRSYPIPLFNQQQFQALTLFVHNDRHGSDENNGSDQMATKNKIRFLIDMRLSKLGAMQIDGFVRPKKLDMILRSEGILPTGLHNELRRSYIKALGAAGYTGALNFQVGRQHWMRMQNPASRGLLT